MSLTQGLAEATAKNAELRADNERLKQISQKQGQEITYLGAKLDEDMFKNSQLVHLLKEEKIWNSTKKTQVVQLKEQLAAATADNANLKEQLAASTADNAKLNEQLSAALAQMAEPNKGSLLLKQCAKVIEEANKLRRELLEVKETSEERIRELNNRVAYVKNEAAARFPATMSDDVVYWYLIQ